MGQILDIKTAIIAASDATSGTKTDAKIFEIHDTKRMLSRTDQVGCFLKEWDEHMDSVEHYSHRFSVTRYSSWCFIRCNALQSNA